VRVYDFIDRHRTLQEAGAPRKSIAAGFHSGALLPMSNRAIARYMLGQVTEKGTEVARFLRRHGPRPSDFGWPCYLIGYRAVEATDNSTRLASIVGP
jgi:hypothetical protein